MVKLTPSFEYWVWKNHRDILGLIMFGHLELITSEMKREYLDWLNTEEGESYLKGGSNYKEEVKND